LVFDSAVAALIARRIASLGLGRIYTWLAVAGLFAIALHWWRPGYTISTGDSGYPPDPLVQLQSSFSAWNHERSVLGSAAGDAWAAPFLLTVLVLKTFFGTSLSQIVLLWLLQAAAWFAMFFFLQRLRVSMTGAALGATGYVLNPWTSLFFGFSYGIAVLLAVLPTTGVLLTSYAPDRARPLTLDLVLLAAVPLATLGGNPALLLLALLAVAPVVALAFLLSQQRREFTGWALATLGLCAIGAAWWLVPLGWQYFDSAHTSVLSPQAWSWVIGRSSILNNLRWNPMWEWNSDYIPFATHVDATPLLYAAQFVPSAMLVLALALCTPEQRTMVRFSALVVAIAIVISKGLHPPAAWLNAALYHLPGMFLFREPTSKAPLIGLPFIAIGIAACYDALSTRLRPAGTSRFARFALRGSLALVLVICILLSAYPVVAGVDRDATDAVPSIYARIPGYWRDAAAYLNAQQDRSDAVALPPNGYYQANYGWFYGADVIPMWLLTRPGDRLVSQGLYWISPQRIALYSELRKAIYAGSPLLVRMLGDAGFGYVIYRGDIYDQPRNLVSLEALRLELAGATQRRFGPLTVFALPHRARAEISSVWIAQTGRPIELGDELELRALEDSLPRLDPRAAVWLGRPAIVESVDDSRHGARRISLRRPVSGLFRAPVFIAASFLGTGSRARSILLQQLSPWRPSGARVCISMVAPSRDVERDVRSYRLFNPSFAPVTADVAILVRPQTDRTYTLRYGQLDAARAVQRSRWPVWLTFARLTVPPGESSLELDGRPGDGGVQLPPYDGGETLGEVHVTTTEAAVPIPRTTATNITFDAQHPLMSLGGRPFDLTLEDDPWVSVTAVVDPGARLNYGVNWLVDVRGARYLIYQRIYPAHVPASATDAITLALARAGLRLTANDLGSVGVRAAELVVSSWERQRNGAIHLSNLRIDWNDRGLRSAPSAIIARIDGKPLRESVSLGSAMRRKLPDSASSLYVSTTRPLPLSVLAVGASPLRDARRSADMALDQDGLLVVRVPGGRAQLISLTDEYDPAWIGIAWRGVRATILPHLLVDRWRNGFVAPPASTVLLVFLGVPIHYALVLIAAGLIVLLAWPLLRGR